MMYHMHEGAFDLPQGALIDRSIQMLELGEEESKTAVVVARQPATVSAEEFCAAFLQENSSRKPRYKLLESGRVDFGGIIAEAATYGWMKDGESLTTHLAVFRSGTNMLTLAATGRASRTSETATIVGQIARTFRFRRVEG